MNQSRGRALVQVSRLVLRYKWLVVAFWVVVAGAGLLGAGRTTNALTRQFTNPGSEAYNTNQQIVQRYGSGGGAAPLVTVVTLPAGETVDSPDVRSQLQALEQRIASQAPQVRVLGYGSTGDRLFVSRDGRTTYDLVYVPPAGADTVVPAQVAVQQAVQGARIDGSPVYLTGVNVLNGPAAAGGGDENRTTLIETGAASVGALLVLLIVFESLLAVVPFLMAVVAIPTTLLIIGGVTRIAEVSYVVLFIVTLVGLGIAIDYSLLVVTRWREERDKGIPNEEAVHNATATAGSSVVFSGTAVGIGLLALLVLPSPFLRSIGYGGMIVPLVSMVIAVTLLPAVLGSVGPRLDWPRLRRTRGPGRGWRAWANLVVRRRVIAAVVGLAIVVGLALPALTIDLGSPNPDTLSTRGPAHDGLRALETSGIGSGVLAPFEVLVASGSPQSVAGSVAALDGVIGTVTEQGRDGSSLVEVLPSRYTDNGSGRALLAQVRSVVRASGAQASVGGVTATGADSVAELYQYFPLLAGLTMLITFLLLARAFRSLLLPLKAVLLNVLSIAAAFGCLVLIWQDGYGSKILWNLPGTEAITGWIPLTVFVYLFGLSMDYEVFILARTREEYDRTRSTDQAAINGIARTGRLVTSAGLILFLTFVVLSNASEPTIKMFATGLGAGILLDATVVRSLLIPPLVSLFGRWNWWLPRPAAWLLRVNPSEARPEGPRRLETA